MTFSEYVKLNMDKAYNREDIKEVPVVNTVAAPVDVSKQLDPKVWNAKIMGKDKVLFFNNRHLNVTELRKEIKALYKANGYENYGFSKLDEGELVRYKTLRDILSNEFLDFEADEQLNPKVIAQIIFDHELKDFEWQPEPLTIR